MNIHLLSIVIKCALRIATNVLLTLSRHLVTCPRISEPLKVEISDLVSTAWIWRLIREVDWQTRKRQVDKYGENVVFKSVYLSYMTLLKFKFFSWWVSSIIPPRKKNIIKVFYVIFSLWSLKTIYVMYKYLALTSQHTFITWIIDSNP